jgi:hypothetical protein
MLTTSQARTYIDLQNEINLIVDPNWTETRNPFLRAAFMEMAEGIDHLPWKFWKHGERNLGQLQLELVDTWHFMISALIIQHDGDLEKAASELLALKDEDTIQFDTNIYVIDTLTLIEKIELLCGLFIVRRMSFPLFFSIMIDCEMTFDDLFKQYVSKNVLNSVRQKNGYKSGTYIKIWGGLEDNVHLQEIMAGLSPTSPTFRLDLHTSLQERYDSIATA